MIEKELFDAVENDNFSKVKKLVKSWANVNAKDEADTPLIGYARSLKVVKFLVENGASLEEPGILSGPCVYYGNMSVLKYFIERGADINSKGDLGMTPLYASVFFYNLKFMVMLLKRGVDVNAKNDEGETALMLAVKNGYDEMVKILLRFGADVMIKDQNGCNAIDIAKNSKNKSLIKILEGPVLTNNYEEDDLLSVDDVSSLEEEDVIDKFTKYWILCSYIIVSGAAIFAAIYEIWLVVNGDLD